MAMRAEKSAAAVRRGRDLMPPTETERDRARVNATLVTIILVAVGVAVTEAALAGRGGADGLWILAGATALFAASLVPPLRINAGGDRSRAVVWACVAIICIQTVYLVAYPAAYPAVSLASIVVVALALSFVRRRALLGLTFTAWIVAQAAILYGVLADGLIDVPQAAHVPILLSTGIAAVTVSMVLLWQFATHMNAALDDARAANARLAQAHERLTELDRLKSRFINSTAHELNTPLTPVLMQLTLLKSTHPDARQSHALVVIERNFNRIVSLVHEMLDVARLQAGRMVIEHGPVDLTGTTLDSVADFADVAASRGVKLEGPAQRSLMVAGDARRISQVLTNLLDNAVRLTPRGGSVTVDLDEDEAHGIVRVVDTGPGLTPDQIAGLFQPFSTVHSEHVEGQQTGLGLYICRGLIEEMGGTITARSDGAGRGASFVLRLPLAQAAGGAGMAPVTGPEGAAGREQQPG